MNIAIFVDKYSSAIDRLAQAVKKHNPHFDIRVLAVHPKRNNLEDLAEAQKLLRWADLVDVHYWKSAIPIKTTFPVEFERVPKILCHFNPYDLHREGWNEYKAVVVGNSSMSTDLPSAVMIPYGIDLSFWKFNKQYTKEQVVMMSVGRIEGKKGVLEVAKACSELGYKFILAGRISDQEYMKKIMEYSVDFREGITDEEMRNAYYEAAVHVCNSVDNFESGTLPILEAMACGVPVLTRMVGHVSDLYDGGNMALNPSSEDNVENLKKCLRELMENEALRINMRQRAWNTVKNYDERKMARKFSSLYYKILSGEEKNKLVSIVIPTKDRGEVFVDCLVGALNQDYPHFEVVVADSGEVPIYKVIESARSKTKVPIKYVRINQKGYTLAQARNEAVIEAEGELIVFCDDRIGMEKQSVSAFVREITPRSWLWGIKDEALKGFVENFSCVRRSDFITGGMFNERIDRYGGMTQEARTRFERQGYMFQVCNQAKAFALCRTSGKDGRRDDIIESKLKLWKMYN